VFLFFMTHLLYILRRWVSLMARNERRYFLIVYTLSV
jgi:hypothetical protein